MSAPSSLVRTSLLLLPMQVVFRAGEALMPVMLAAWFGRGHDTDLHVLAAAGTTLVGSLVFQSFQDSSIVPILLEAKETDPAGVHRLRGALWGYNVVAGALLALLLCALGLGYSALFSPAADFQLVQLMLPLLAVQIALMGQKTFFLTMLHIERQFFVTPIASCLGVVTNIAIVWLGKNALGVPAIALGLAAGEAVALGVAFVAARRLLGIEMTPNLQRSEPLRRFFRLVSAEVGGSAITRVNPLVDQLVASFSKVNGGGTLLRYSNDVATTPTSLLSSSLLPVLLAELATLAAKLRFDDFERVVRRACLVVVVVMLAAAGLLFAVREPVLRLAFFHGAMDAGGIQRMADILPYHLVGLAPFGVLLVLARAHVALKNSRLLVRLGAFNAIANAVLNVALLGPLGLEGLALATSLVHTLVAVIFFAMLRVRLDELRSAPPAPPEEAS